MVGAVRSSRFGRQAARSGHPRHRLRRRQLCGVEPADRSGFCISCLRATVLTGILFGVLRLADTIIRAAFRAFRAARTR